MKYFILIVLLLSASSSFAGSVQDMHKSVLARKNAVTENKFDDDPNCTAVYNFEDGALTVDSKGGNTLDNNGASADTGDYKQGGASVDFELSETDYMTIADGDLDAGVFGRSDGSAVGSICFWIKLESMVADSFSATKHNPESDLRSLALEIDSSDKLGFTSGYSSGTAGNFYDYGTVFALATWYHVTFTLDGSDNYRIRIRNGSTGALLSTDLTGTLTNSISLTTAALVIGARADGAGYSGYLDGKLDELVYFKDVLTVSEIDQIYAGTYGH